MTADGVSTDLKRLVQAVVNEVGLTDHSRFQLYQRFERVLLERQKQHRIELANAGAPVPEPQTFRIVRIVGASAAAEYQSNSYEEACVRLHEQASRLLGEGKDTVEGIQYTYGKVLAVSFKSDRRGDFEYRIQVSIPQGNKWVNKP